MTITQLMNHYAHRGIQLTKRMDYLDDIQDPIHFSHLFDQLDAELERCETLNDLFADLRRTQGYAQD